MLISRVNLQKEERPFVFARLALTDNATISCTDKDVIDNISTIQVTLRWTMNMRTTRGIGAPVALPTPSAPVLENVVKANLSHQVGSVHLSLRFQSFS